MMAEPVVIKPIDEYTPEEWQRVLMAIEQGRIMRQETSQETGAQNNSVIETPDFNSEYTDFSVQEPVIDNIDCSTDFKPEKIDRTIDTNLLDIVAWKEAYVRVVLYRVYKCELCSWYGWKMVDLKKHHCIEHGQDLEEIEGNESETQAIKVEEQVELDPENICCELDPENICWESCSKDKLEMIVHRRWNTNKPTVCNICYKGFSFQRALIIHQKIHSGETPFICKICNKGFSQSSYLITHLKTHSGEKSFKKSPLICKICKKWFRRPRNLTIHLRVVHHCGEQPFFCKVCNKEFSQSDEFSVHFRTHSD